MRYILDGASCLSRKPVLPIEFELYESGGEEEESLEMCLDAIIKIKESLYSKASENIKDAQARYKRDYDRKHSKSKVNSQS